MRRVGKVNAALLLVAVFFTLSAAATTAELYFSSDKNGENRVTNVQEGSQVWMVVVDPDENIDCDVRDKFWTDAKVFDPKTGAYINWSFAPARVGAAVESYGRYQPGHYPQADIPGDIVYFEETGADTGLFVSSQAMQIGTRLSYDTDHQSTHWVGLDFAGTTLLGGATGHHGPATGVNVDFGQWEYMDGHRVAVFLPFPVGGPNLPIWVAPFHGRFENMDTLVGMIVDENDPTDVATAMMKIVDTQSTIAWDQQIYKDANGAATITVTDPDENLNCNAVEVVPVFIIVNPESWNPVQPDSANGFCMLKQFGGIDPVLHHPGGPDVLDRAIDWHNIYDSGLGDPWSAGKISNGQPAAAGSYFMQYPTSAFSGRFGPDNVTYFDTSDWYGRCRVMFYAQETGANTGVFQLNLNSILVDLGFNSLRVRDVLMAYYLDPNDEDDFQVAAAYIEARENSITSFTDASRQDVELYWIGRDPVYVQVIDSNANVDPCCPEQVVVHICDPHEWDDTEWLVLDETGSNSPVFFTNAGTELAPAWSATGIGDGSVFLTDAEALGDAVPRPFFGAFFGGYQLVLDNWRLEAYNEDHVYVQYNDVYYTTDTTGIGGLGDSDQTTAFPPKIDRVRVANDVSFDLLEIADTQVYNGSTVSMYFLDRQGSRVSGYRNSDCVFIEVVDPDQNEDVLRRERVDAFWDGGRNTPFGPKNFSVFECGWTRLVINPLNALLGDTNIFNSAPNSILGDPGRRDDEILLAFGSPKIYVLNPRSGQWAGLDLLETGVSTGDFVSVICVDLVNVTACVPTLGALAGDTIVAFYQDPSNHSDSAMISTKVGIGGGATPGQASSTTFIDRDGNVLSLCQPGQEIRVRVTDLSHTQDVSLPGAVVVDGVAYDLTTFGSQSHMFVTEPITGDLQAGEMITATYIDPADPTDTSSASIPVVAAKLSVERFYAGPNPAAGPVTFGYEGTGIASVMSVEVYDLAGHVVWASEMANVTKIVWNLAAGARPAANGCYIYQVTATDGTDTFNGKGTLFINR